jgi:hypothetical protein
MSKGLKAEELERIGSVVRDQYRAAVMCAESTASKLDTLSALRARANAAPRAVSPPESQVCRKPETENS